MISIIIPHHEESIDFMKPLLTSLDNQIGIDFNDIEILFCNDAPDCVITDFSAYPNIAGRIKNITVHCSGNPGMSRQEGIDVCEGSHIFFCDSDDMLYNSTVLYDLLSRCDTDVDIYHASMLEEIMGADGKMFYNVQSNQMIWLFPKLYRKEFLVKNNLRFNPELKVQEDCSFNFVALACRPKMMQLPYCAYVYRWNKNSITRKNGSEFVYASAANYTTAMECAFEEVIRRGIANPAQDMLEHVAYQYVHSQKEMFMAGGEKYARQLEARLVQFIEKHNLADKLLSENGITALSRIIAQTAGVDKFWYPKEGYDDFVHRILGQTT